MRADLDVCRVGRSPEPPNGTIPSASGAPGGAMTASRARGGNPVLALPALRRLDPEVEVDEVVA
jgi:hypothetical protein